MKRFPFSLVTVLATVFLFLPSLPLAQEPLDGNFETPTSSQESDDPPLSLKDEASGNTVSVTIEADEESSSEEYSEIIEDDRTLLDMFGLVAKEYLTQRLIPDTDPECQWDWRVLRCEPSPCGCEFRPKWGDYHLGRSCRLSLNYSHDDGMDSSCFSLYNDHRPSHLVVGRPLWRFYIRRVSTLLKKSIQGIVKSGQERYQTHKENCQVQRCLYEQRRRYVPGDSMDEQDANVEELLQQPWHERLLCGIVNLSEEDDCGEGDDDIGRVSSSATTGSTGFMPPKPPQTGT